MSQFAAGDSVIVAGYGPGVVTELVGGPYGKQYRVTLTEAQLYTGFSSNYLADGSELTAAAAVPAYAPGDIVFYQGRRAEVEAYDPANGSVQIVADPPLPDPNPEVLIESRVVLPAWKVYLQQLKATA